jgi:iron complex outermembrane receptor protein
VGSKTRIGNGLLTAALFRTDTDDEIVVDTSSGGRTSYKNAGKTRRQGVEVSLDQQFAENWKLKMAWTYLDATYRTNVCSDADCNGNRMPGIAATWVTPRLAGSQKKAGMRGQTCAT